MPKLRKLKWQEVEKFLFARGCVFDRQKGSHRIYKKQGTLKGIVLPTHDTISPGVLLKNLSNIGSSKDDLENYLLSE